MKNLNCLWAVTCLLFTTAKAQFPLPAETAGVTGQRLFLRTTAGLTFGNACTLDSLPGFSAGIWSSRSALLQELSEYGVAVRVLLPGRAYLTGGLASRGFSLFRYQEATGMLAKQFAKKIVFATGAGWLSIHQGEGLGSRSLLLLRSGLMANLSSKVDVAAGMRVPLRDDPMMPVSDFQIGVRYRFSPIFHLQAETGIIGARYAVTAAIRYQAFRRFTFDMGIGGYPFRMGMGCRLQTNRMTLLFSAIYRRLPGLTPAVGVENAFSADN